MSLGRSEQSKTANTAMNTKDPTASCTNLEQIARQHPTRTVLTMVATGIVAGVLVRVLRGRDKHPTRMETAIKAVNGIGERVRKLFR